MNINIKIIIKRLNVPVVFPIKEDEDKKEASSSRLLIELFRSRTLLKLSPRLLFFERVVKRRSDRRSSSSFIVLSIESYEFSSDGFPLKCRHFFSAFVCKEL
jgi:hypothetical protein